MNEAERRRISVHEAGHTLAALLMGRRWNCALFDDGGVAGAGELVDVPDFTPATADTLYAQADLRAIIDDAILTAAGHVAERLDAGMAFVGAIKQGGDSMMLDAAGDRLLGGWGDHSTRQLFAEFVATAARRLLGPHLESIRMIADALFERGTLTADEVEKIHKHNTERKDDAKQ